MRTFSTIRANMPLLRSFLFNKGKLNENMKGRGKRVDGNENDSSQLPFIIILISQ